MQCVLLGDWPVIRFPRRASRSGQEFGQFRGSVLQRRQRPLQHGLRECADQIPPAGGDGGGPFVLGDPGRAVALIERVQAGAEPVLA